MLPRIIHQAYAAVVGYFWIPCPRCGRMFGGHEQHGGTNYYDAFDSPRGRYGAICCKDCPEDRFVGWPELTP